MMINKKRRRASALDKAAMKVEDLVPPGSTDVHGAVMCAQCNWTD